MVSVQQNFVESLLICMILQYPHIVHGTTEGLVTESTFLVGSQECVNLMDILLVDILMVDVSRPGTVRTHYLGNDDRPEDGVQCAVIQTVCAKDPEDVLYLCSVHMT